MRGSVCDKIYWGDFMYKKDINIESYDGQDSFYSGTDEEYKEFLKNSDLDTDEENEAEPVANTQKINLNETINIQSVIDKFRKTADGIETGAKKLKDSVVSKMDMFKSKKENENSEKDEDTQEVNAEENKSELNTEEISTEPVIQDSIETSDTIKINPASMTEFDEKFDDVNEKIKDVREDLESIKKSMAEITDKLGEADARQRERINELSRGYSALGRSVDDVASNVAEIKQALNSVSRLNDSVFDLKNTQLNTKNVLSNLELSFKRLKKKYVLGITVLSILSVIVIALEVILMLS